MECVSAPGASNAPEEFLFPPMGEGLERLREISCRLLRTHPLRSADALQLAAAIIASLDRPSTPGFVCADWRLVGGARKGGFPVPGIPPFWGFAGSWSGGRPLRKLRHVPDDLLVRHRRP